MARVLGLSEDKVVGSSNYDKLISDALNKECLRIVDDLKRDHREEDIVAWAVVSYYLGVFEPRNPGLEKSDGE